MHKGRDDWDSSSKWIQRQKMWGIFQRKIWGFWTSNARQYINRQIAIFLLLPKVQAFDPCVQKQSTQKWVKIRRVQFPHRTIQISTVVENSQLSQLPRYRWKIWTDPLSEEGSPMQCFFVISMATYSNHTKDICSYICSSCASFDIHRSNEMLVKF